MVDGQLDLGIQQHEVLIEESLDGLQVARCWVERGAFSDQTLDQWWNMVSHEGEGWRQNDIRMFGQWHKEPRLTAWWGPAYRYANVVWQERDLEGAMGQLADRVSGLANFSYNGVLVNGYRDGRDSMGWHRDNEPEIDTASIASLSLGATRTFKIRHRTTKEVVNVELAHGDLLVMEHLQTLHEHSVPKRAKVAAPRMNFTFRRLV